MFLFKLKIIESVAYENVNIGGIEILNGQKLRDTDKKGTLRKSKKNKKSITGIFLMRDVSVFNRLP